VGAGAVKEKPHNLSFAIDPRSLCKRCTRQVDGSKVTSAVEKPMATVIVKLPIKLKQAVQLQRETDGRGRRRLA
jgi:hypothetical protein